MARSQRAKGSLAAPSAIVSAGCRQSREHHPPGGQSRQTLVLPTTNASVARSTHLARVELLPERLRKTLTWTRG